MNQDVKVRIAKNSGFCFGVKRAINLAFEASQEFDKIVTLGPIIHNPQMVAKLQEKGIEPVNNLQEVDGRPVIIRSHGIEKTEYKQLKLMGIPLIDATCPFVSSSQKYATKLSKESYKVIIIGNKHHPEVVALQSYIQGEALIITSPDELDGIKDTKLAVICQTTQQIELLHGVVDYLLPRTKELRIINSICTATKVRQESTSELAKKSDMMIVIGGKNSSNTKMLHHISKKWTDTLLIETADEIKCKELSSKKKIGLTAGASTPDWIIVKVYNKITKCLWDKKKTVTNVEDIPGYREEN